MNTCREYQITGGALAVTLTETGHGAALTRIEDAAGMPILTGGSRPFFKLKLRNLSDGTDAEYLSDRDFSAFRAETSDELTRLYFSAPGDLSGITVIITAQPEDNGIRWLTRVENLRSDLSLTGVEYPKVWFDARETTKVFYPRGCGIVWEDIAEIEIRRSCKYPTSQASMSYFAVYDGETRRGLYIGYEDREGIYKELRIDKETDEHEGCFSGLLPAESMGIARNSQDLPGEAVWRLFDGDWFDAAMEYKKFAMTAAWMPALDENGIRAARPAPLWSRDHWWLSSVTEDSTWTDIALKADAMVGVPSGSHVYSWHRIPFDNDYPHYFPIRDCVPAALARLQDAGMLTMPYINGRLWDTHDQEERDWLFSTLAKPWATKDIDGNLFEEVYLSKEKDGTPVSLAVMCPSSSLWQDKVSELADGVLGKMDCDALYIDQVACAEAKPCCDPRHAHAPGGGAWWINAYRTLMDRLNLRKPARKFFTTEGTSDAYLRSFDGFLSWMWWYNGQVPALTAVYAGTAVFFGREYTNVSDSTARIYAAQALTFGEQLGWIRPETFLALQSRDFVASCARIRHRCHDFIAEGEMMRPPVTECSGEPVIGGSQVGEIRCAPVLSAVWKNRASGKGCLILAAPAEKDTVIRLQHTDVRGALHFTGTHEIDAAFDGEWLTLTVPAGAVLFAEL